MKTGIKTKNTKRNFRFFYPLLGLVFLMIVNQHLKAQTLEAEKSYTLSKDAKKGYLGSFNFNENTKEYTLVFVRDKNKETIYETMKFDYNFNKIDDVSESLSLMAASKKFDFVDYSEEKWVNPEVVKVDAKAWGSGNIILQKGNISREWVRPTKFDVGDYTVSYSGYWKYNFNVTESITPKIEVEVEIDPRAPQFVKNMAQKAANKIHLTAYMTDEPGFGVQTGKRYYNPRKLTSGNFHATKTFSSASGDIVVVGSQSYAVSKTYFNRWVVLKYSAKDLSELARSFIPFDYGVEVFYHQELSDHTMILLYAPLPGMYTKPADPNPNPRAFTYVRIDKDAKILDRIEFESPSSKWDISAAQLTDNGDLYIYGEAIQKNNKKYNAQQIGAKNFDNLQVMKISNGKIDFIATTTLDEFKAKLQIPSNMKKIDPYNGKKFDVGDMLVTSSGDFIITGQENEEGKYGNISLFHFGPDGKLKAEYGYKLEETGKEAQSMPTNFFVFENTDNQSLTWIVYEMVGATDSKLLLYPRVATIDLASAKVSDFKQFGYNKDEQFFVDNSRPVVPVDNLKEVVFFGANKKDSEIWFCRVKLGK